MKQILTTDWRLGARFHAYDRTDEHRHFLAWLMQVVTDENPDEIVVSGELFADKTPSTDAIAMACSTIRHLLDAVPDMRVVVACRNTTLAQMLTAVGATVENIARPNGLPAPLPDDFNECDKPRGVVSATIVDGATTEQRFIEYEPLRKLVVLPHKPSSDTAYILKELRKLPERKGDDAAAPYVEVRIEALKPSAELAAAIRETIATKSARLCTIRRMRPNGEQSGDTAPCQPLDAPFTQIPAKVVAEAFRATNGEEMSDEVARMFAETKRACEARLRADASQAPQPATNDMAEAFLKAAPNAESALLSQLTDTTLYAEISKEIHERAHRAETAWQTVADHIAALREQQLSPEELDLSKESVMLLKSQIQCDEDQLKRTQTLLSWYDRYHKARAAHDKALEELNAARRDYTSLTDEMGLMERYDEVQTFRNHYYAVQADEMLIDQLHTALSEAQAKRRAALDTIEEEKRNYNEAYAALNDFRLTSTQREEDFKNSFILEGRIGASAAELAVRETEWRILSEELAECEENLALRETERDEETTKHDKLMQRRQAMAVHHRLIEESDHVIAQLDRMDDLKRTMGQLQAGIDKASADLAATRHSLATQREAQLELAAKTKTLSDELYLHTQANRGLNGADIQRHLIQCADLCSRTRAAKELWANISAGYVEIEEREDELRGRLSWMEQQEKIRLQLVEALAVATERFETLHDSFTLSQSTNIIEQRSHLKEGTPCATCGATHHPYYSEQERELGQILSDLEKDYEEAKSQLESARDNLANQELLMARAHGENAQLEANLTYIRQTQKHNEELWAGYEDLAEAFEGCSKSINAESRRMLINQLSDTAQHDLRNEQEALNTFNSHQEAINQTIRTIADIEAQNHDSLVKCTELSAAQELYEGRIADLQSQLIACNDRFEATANHIDDIIHLPDWRASWEESHEGFVGVVTRMQEEWQATQSALEASDRRMFQLREDVLALEQRRHNLLDRHNTTQSIVNTLKQDIEDKRNEIVHLLGQPSADEALAASKAEYTDLEAKCKESLETFETSQMRLVEMDAEMQHTETLLHQTEEQLRAHREQLDIAIARFNREHSMLQYFELQQLFSDSRDWLALRASITSATQRMQAAQLVETQLSQRIVELISDADHPTEANDDSEPLLRQRLPSLNSRLERWHAQLSESEARLRAHQHLSERIDALMPQLETLETEKKRWQSLCNAVGGPDGRAFCRMAQASRVAAIAARANSVLAYTGSRYRLMPDAHRLRPVVVDTLLFEQPCPTENLSPADFGALADAFRRAADTIR